MCTVSIPTNLFFDKTKCRFTHPTQTTRIKTRSMLYSCINKKHERSKTCVRVSQKYETRILKLNPYVRASQTPLFPHLKKNKQPHSFYNPNREKQKKKLGKHALLQTKRQSHGRLTFPPAGVRREKNVRVPNVLAAGALGKKHLQILSFSPPFFLSFTFQCRLFSIKEKASFLSPCFASVPPFYALFFCLFFLSFFLLSFCYFSALFLLFFCSLFAIFCSPFFAPC